PPRSTPFPYTTLFRSAESPSQFLLRKERELLVADALAQLAPDHREVILLRSLQQLEFAEVARRMNRSRPAVQMLWTRALKKLQRSEEHTSELQSRGHL